MTAPRLIDPTPPNVWPLKKYELQAPCARDAWRKSLGMQVGYFPQKPGLFEWRAIIGLTFAWAATPEDAERELCAKMNIPQFVEGVK